MKAILMTLSHLKSKFK